MKMGLIQSHRPRIEYARGFDQRCQISLRNTLEHQKRSIKAQLMSTSLLLSIIQTQYNSQTLESMKLFSLNITIFSLVTGSLSWESQGHEWNPPFPSDSRSDLLLTPRILDKPSQVDLHAQVSTQWPIMATSLAREKTSTSPL